MGAPLSSTSVPGVYQRGSRWVAVYREDSVERKQSAATFRAAREVKVRCTAQEAVRRASLTLPIYALERVDHYAGRGANDVMNDRTRREYRRLLIAYALAYFAPEEPLRSIDEQRTRAFADWLCRQTDAAGLTARSTCGSSTGSCATSSSCTTSSSTTSSASSAQK